MTGQGGPKTPPAAWWQDIVARWLLQLNAEAAGRNALPRSDAGLYSNRDATRKTARMGRIRETLQPGPCSV
jgi:hypothetical protein